MSDPATMFDLTGQVAIVTGGSGMLGSEYVKTLAGAGAKVANIDVRMPDPPQAHLNITADITARSDVARAFDEIELKLGTPTILVNNAGLDVRPDAPASENGLFEEYPEASWDAVIDSHLKGAFLVSQEFIGRNRAAKKGGSIINVSSTYGVVTPDQSVYEYRRMRGETFFKPVAYSVAKSGMLNFTRWLAEYAAPHRIRVNTLVPGGVENNQDEEFMREYSKRTILGRMARKDEYNGAVLYLAAPASSYVTGSMIIVDGGWTAR